MSEPTSTKKWQVWADGECLLTCFSVERAAEYASHLNDDWRCVEIVTIERSALRVR